jgi:hypothetical protein
VWIGLLISRQEREDFKDLGVKSKGASFELSPDIQRMLNMAGVNSSVKIQVVFLLFKLIWLLFFIYNAKLGVFPKPANTLKMVFLPFFFPVFHKFSFWENQL